MSVLQRGAANRTYYGTSISVAFTTQFFQHEGAAANSNPSEGSDLIVCLAGNADWLTCDTDQGDTGVAIATFNSNWQIWLISNISSGVTSIDITSTGSGGPNIYFIEDSAQVSEENTTAWGLSGEATLTQDIAYTTATADELVVAMITPTGNKSYAASGGSVPIAAVDAAESRAVIYLDSTTAETSAIAWTQDTGGESSGAVVTFSRGGGSSFNAAWAIHANTIIG